MSAPTPYVPNGRTVIEADGQQYYIIGKNRIKIAEHFSDNGPRIEDALLNLIKQKVRESSAKIA